MNTSKCLIIRLQEPVANDVLPYYNIAEITIDETFKSFDTGDTFSLVYESYNKKVFVKDGRAKISVDGGEPTDSVLLTEYKNIKVEALTENEEPYTICFPLDGLITIIARNKSTGKYLCAKFDINSLKSVPLGLETYMFKGAHVTGSLNSLQFVLDGASALDKFTMAVTNVVGDIGTVAFNGTTFNIRSSVNIDGDIATFNAPNVIELNINLTRITGDLQAWANNMWDNGNGRTSGVCQVTANNLITWGATPLNNGIRNITFSSNAPTITQV